MRNFYFIASIAVAVIFSGGCSVDPTTPPLSSSGDGMQAQPETSSGESNEFQVTDSGLKYRILRQGSGPKPTADSTVRVHYRGWLPNADNPDEGMEFDSSYKRGEPITFPLSGVIPGWTEGMQLVEEGGQIELEVPPHLGYGETGAGGVIPPNATLRFVVELLEAPQPVAPGPVDADASEEFTTTASGLRYRIRRQGSGDTPEKTDQVTVHYKGWLPSEDDPSTGVQFDSSYDRGEPTSFRLDQVIPGWTEGLQLIQEGGMIELAIPSDLAYGERGAGADIPPNADLRFLVELLKVGG